MADRSLPEKGAHTAEPDGSARMGLRFRPPRMLFSGVERPYLLSRLAEGLARQTVVLHAPPGFGKTALMKAAYEKIALGELPLPGPAVRVERCCWLTIAPGMSPERFIADLREALGLRDEIRATTLTDILEEAGQGDGITVLFLDGIDEIDLAGQPRLLEELVLEAPDNLRIACSSFRQPHLPLARLKARGVLTGITAGELAFGRSEMRRLLSRSTTAALIDPLMRITRGWPALAQLAAGIVSTSQSEEERDRLLAGRHADLAGFVREAVIRRFSTTLLEMLRRTAIFEDFCPELAVDLGCEPLESGDVLLLDDLRPVIDRQAAGWLALHPVLRACLLDDARHDLDRLEKALHTRAAAWFAGHGLLERAVSHAARGGDFRMAEEIIGRAGGVDIFLRAGHKVLEHLIDNFPPDVLHASPGLTLCYAVVLSKRGNAAAGRERLELLKAEGEWTETALAAVDRGVLDHIDSLIDVYEDKRMASGQAERLERVAASLPPHATWELAWIHNHLCILYTRSGDLEAARLSALKALGYYREERTAYAQVFMLVHLGLVGMLAGQFSAALQFCREAEDLVERSQWTDRNLMAIARLATADILYLQGEVLLVEQMLSESVEPLVRGESWVDLFTRLFWLLARSRLQVSGFDTAGAAIDKAEEVAAERALPRLKIAAGIMRVDLLVRAGMIESAAQAHERIPVLREEAAADQWTWREACDFDIASARLALAQGQALKALDALEDLVSSCKSSNRGYHRLIGEIMAVRAAWKAGRQQQALAYLQSAIALARAHEATQLFLDEGQEFATTLRAIVRRFGLKAFSVDVVEFMSRIVGHGFGRQPRPSVATRNAESGIPAPKGLLSTRETTVLKLLTEGRSNKEMARTLGLSEATIKFHLKNIYVKLGVGRRGMAVSVGRHLNLTASD